MKISTTFFLFILLTGLDQLDWFISLDQGMYVVKQSHLLLKIGYGHGTNCFGQFAEEIGSEVVLVPLSSW